VNSIVPVVIDFGLLQMEDANWTMDESLVGQFVRIVMDRLEISWSAEPDWPDWADAADHPGRLRGKPRT
jgi:hypothetical protein